MPVYNCDLYVGEAIESILNQSESNFEFIIIDDHSTDNTRKVVGLFRDSRIKLIVKPENTGYAISLNLGLKIAKGTYIARMDGDDISHINRFKKQIDFLQDNPEIAMCGTWYKLMPTNEIIQYPTEDEDIKIALLDYCSIGHPTVMFRRSFMIKHRLKYNVSLEPAEDYDLWTRITSIGKLANIPEVLLNYRLHDSQVSFTKQQVQFENALFCKTRMICSAIKNPTDIDYSISRLIVMNQFLKSFTELSTVMSWLDYIIVQNIKSHFYIQSKLVNYITQVKKTTIRRYYLNTSSYNPKVLYDFKKLNNEFDKYFTTFELTKFSLKCLLYWK